MHTTYFILDYLIIYAIGLVILYQNRYEWGIMPKLYLHRKNKSVLFAAFVASLILAPLAVVAGLIANLILIFTPKK